jgi:hypothetical protein
MVDNYYLLGLDTVSYTLKMGAVGSFETLVLIQYNDSYLNRQLRTLKMFKYN